MRNSAAPVDITWSDLTLKGQSQGDLDFVAGDLYIACSILIWMSYKHNRMWVDKVYPYRYLSIFCNI